jgi:sodium-dependent dicarboxylate transporter 2/3/5
VRRADATRGREVIERARTALGPMSGPEKRVMIVFLLVAIAWMTREILADVPGLDGLSDMGIAVAGALALFIIPAGRGAGRLIDWKTAERIPWGIVVLFGGGLSLANAIEVTGVSDWLATELSFLRDYPELAIIAALVLVTLVATELMSNVATLTAMLPIVAAFAKGAGIDPLLLVLPVSLAASLGYMLPTATAPNAVAYGTGLAPMRSMLSLGLKLNLIGAVVIISVAYAGKALLG